jgi:hypothetical protein
MPMTLETAKQKAQDLVDEACLDIHQFENGTVSALRDAIAAALIEASTLKVVAKERPPFVFEDDDPGCEHDWVRDGQIARCAKDGCDFVRAPQGDEREMTTADQS